MITKELKLLRQETIELLDMITEALAEDFARGVIAKRPKPKKKPKLSLAFLALGPTTEHQGLFWSGIVPKTMNHANALAYAKSIGARLPTKAEYEALAKDNIFKDMKDRWFWSGSFHPYSGDFAFVLYGVSGYVDSAYVYDTGGSVRCVVSNKRDSK